MIEYAFDKRALLTLYRKYSDNGKKKRFLMPSFYFKNIDNSQARFWIFESMKTILNNELDSEFMLYYYYDERAIMVIEMTKDLKDLTLNFPYEEWDKYIFIIKRINDLVSSDGVCLVYVNNVPYALEFGISLRTSNNFEEILTLANKYHLKRDYTKDVITLQRDALLKADYNVVTILPNATEEMIQLFLDGIIWHAPKSKYPFGTHNSAKKKVFVSYSHKNKEIVHEIIQKLRDYGLDFWLDEEQIDYGDNMFDKIHQGMLESELPIIFISQATKESMFARYELKTFLQKIIYDTAITQKWVVVKLDDVSPNDIVMGLEQYKYFDYQNNDIQSLVDVLRKKMNK